MGKDTSEQSQAAPFEPGSRAGSNRPKRRSPFRKMIRRFHPIEARISSELQRVSLPLLRYAFGVVFIWFGALKVSNTTPIADFVARTLPWFDRAWLIPAVGLFEIAIGIGMIIGRFLFLVCAALVGHLTGTFLSLVMQPEITFQDGNPLVLAAEGEFVMKNLVFIAAGLVLAARFSYQEIVTVPVTRQSSPHGC